MHVGLCIVYVFSICLSIMDGVLLRYVHLETINRPFDPCFDLQYLAALFVTHCLYFLLDCCAYEDSISESQVMQRVSNNLQCFGVQV